MLGSTLPFAAVPEERHLGDGRTDPRLSITERYEDRDDYLTRVRATAEALLRQRYILEEDVDLLMQTAAERFDAFAGARGPL
jgi:hypothetical protein